MINMKKLMTSFVMLYGGFMAQNLSASQSYQLWEDNTPKQDSLYMKNISPDFNAVSDHWRVEKDIHSNVYKIVGFPGQDRSTGDQKTRTYESYRPKFSGEYAIDTLILTRSSNSSFLDDFWTPNGFSCHGIMTKEGAIFVHADIFKDEKGQMAGTYNNHSLEIAFIDNDDHLMSEIQLNSLKAYKDYVQKAHHSVKLVDAYSIFEIKQKENSPGFESGRVENIDQVRKSL